MPGYRRGRRGSAWRRAGPPFRARLRPVAPSPRAGAACAPDTPPARRRPRSRGWPGGGPEAAPRRAPCPRRSPGRSRTRRARTRRSPAAGTSLPGGGSCACRPRPDSRPGCGSPPRGGPASCAARPGAARPSRWRDPARAPRRAPLRRRRPGPAAPEARPSGRAVLQSAAMPAPPPRRRPTLRQDRPWPSARQANATRAAISRTAPPSGKPGPYQLPTWSTPL